MKNVKTNKITSLIKFEKLNNNGRFRTENLVAKLYTIKLYRLYNTVIVYICMSFTIFRVLIAFFPATFCGTSSIVRYFIQI